MRPSCSVVPITVLALTAPALAQKPTARAHRTDEAPVIDGVLDDAVWEQAEPVRGLTLFDPVEGGTPSQDTEFRFLVDREHLYLGVRCFDTEPDKLASTRKQRDAFLDTDDRIEFVFDTFRDQRNAFWFQINPTGSKSDALITNNGSDFNKPWDGIWDGITTVDAGGWTAEFAFPFKTLNFKEGLETWGFNLERRIGRTRERARWSAPLRRIGIFNVAEAGRLSGISDIDQGVGLDVTPFVVGTYLNDREMDETDTSVDAGFDAFYKVTPGLTLSVTANTDFAETEVDERQINLTRFPLFFPERRDFFLQDAGLFEFGDGSNLGFFSRRIGLTDDGQEVPILGGAKLTGRAGDFNIGVMNVQTDDVDGLDGENLAVARVTRNVGEQSTVGAIFTNGNPADGSSNTVAGIDGSYRTSSFLGDKVLRANGWYMASDAEGVSGEEAAFGASIEYPNDVWSAYVDYREVQPDFQPGLGFVPRRDNRRTTTSVTYQPRIEETIRSLEFSIFHSALAELEGEESRDFLEIQPIGINWDSGESARIELEHVEETLLEEDESGSPFEIFSGITIPDGDYEWDRWRLEFDTARQRKLSASMWVSGGDFYDGTRDDVGIDLQWRPGALFTAGIQFERSDITLAAGSFDTELVRGRFDFAFTPELSWSNFVQWDNISDTYGLNSRVRWIPRPGREFFFVLNEVFDSDDDPGFVAFKAWYTVRF